MNLILKLHNYLAILALISLVVFIIYNSFYLNKLNLSFSKSKKRLSLLATSILHIQFVLGLILLYRHLSLLVENQISFGTIMKNSSIRYKIIEHPMMMLIGVIFITLSHKNIKSRSKSNLKKSLLFSILSLVFVLSRLPFDLLLKR